MERKKTLEAQRKRITSFVENDSYPKELRNILIGLTNVLVSTQKPYNEIISDGLSKVIEIIDGVEGNHLEVIEPIITDNLIPLIKNINPTETILNNHNNANHLRIATGNSKKLDKYQLKRDSLYFDYFALQDGLNLILEDPELTWLNDKGLIFSLELDNQFSKGLAIAESKMVNTGFDLSLGKDNETALAKLNGLLKITCANGVSEINGLVGIPWFLNETEYLNSFSQGSDSCLSIILKSLPVPNELTPWEAILDFRNNPDSIAKRQALISWQNKITRQNLSAAEIGDELAHLINEYSQEMRLHRIKAKSSIAQIIVVGVAEIAESLVKFKFKALAEKLFSFQNTRLKLGEKELKAKGREIAYIPMTREKFKKSR